MKWASAIVETADLGQAVSSLLGQIQIQLEREAPDLVLAFFSEQFRDRAPELQRQIRLAWPEAALAGCSALGVVGAGREIEQRPAVCLCAAVLPDVEVATRHFGYDQLPDEDAPQEAWQEMLHLSDWDHADFVLLADPFSASVESFLAGLDFVWPQGTKIGGLASGGGQPGENVLFCGDDVHHEGGVLLALRGNIVIDPIVSQGCRPIGEPLAITCCERNLVLELDGIPPVEYIKDLLPRISAYDRDLLATSLFLGLQMDPLNASPVQGDYLVRNLIGVDQESGAMAVGAHPEEGQIVQFHLRDKLAAAQDLVVQLDGYVREEAPTRPRGALMFSCIGRGEYLYGEADHDSKLLERRLGSLPAAGFFCNGEIGPVGGSTYLHGYTSSFGIVRPRTPDDAT